jgi:hypothetical protein
MRGYPEFNFPAFHEATAKLRAEGHEVFSPAEKDMDDGFDVFGMKGDEPVDIREMLAFDLDYVCKHAEAVVVLPGWHESPGVNAEVAAARALGKPVWTLENVLRLDEQVPWGPFKFSDMQEAAEVRVVTLPDPKGNTWQLSSGSFGRWGHEADPAALKDIIRTFDGGATRDTDTGKLDYEGFLSPRVLVEFAKYMHKHRVQSDGSLRSSDNWQKGMPREVYMKSMFRHFMDVWQEHREPADPGFHMEALMALLFNVQGYALELMREGSIVGD